MKIEEKAKAYDEALKQIKECTPDENAFITIYPQEIFPELKESKDEEKPNGGIVLEDFNEGDGFYKVNLAYLSKEQVEEIENIVKKWNPELKESEDERIRKMIINHLTQERGSLSNKDATDAIKWLEKQGDKDNLIKELSKYKAKYT